MAADQHSSGAPWRNFYGRFKGKTLRPGQEEALESDLAQLSLGPVSWTENPDRTTLDLAQIFNASEIWLEIGFGGGEHLVHQAVENSETGLIGCEPYINGVAMLLQKIRRAEAQNIRTISVATRNSAPGFSTRASGARCSGVTKRRRWWRRFGQGSG